MKDICGKSWSSLDSRIVAGDKVGIETFPWLVSIRTDGIHSCGGSIITEKWVVTAAHCFKGKKNLHSFRIAAGASNQQSGNFSLHNATDIVLKTEPGLLEDDIALVQVSPKFKWKDDGGSRFIAPVCIPDEDVDFEGTATMVGWGAIEDKGEDYKKSERFTHPSEMHKFDMKVVNCDQLKDKHKDVSQLKKVCSVNASLCVADSGGPFAGIDQETNKAYLLGVISFGYKDGNEHVPCGDDGVIDVFSKVSYYRDWIKSNTGL